MKQGIHPEYQVATVICACGNTFQTRSTQSEIRTDICGVCHPFYTGEQRIIDTAGQVERFNRRMEATQGERRPSKRQQRLQVRAASAEGQRRLAREATSREQAANRPQAAPGEADADARSSDSAAEANEAQTANAEA